MNLQPSDSKQSIHRKFIRGIAWFSVADMLVRLRSILLLPILTRTLGAIDYGIWSQISTSVGMLSSVGNFGVSSAMHRYLPGLPDKDMRNQFWTSMLTLTAGALLVAVPFLIFSKPIAKAFFGGAENIIFVYLGGILMLVKVIQSNLFLYFRLSLRINVYSILLISQAILSLVAYLLAALFGKELLIIALTAVLLDLILTLIVLIYLARTLGFGELNFDHARKYLAYGLPTAPLAFFNWALNSADRYVVAFYLGTAQLGVYSVAYGLSLWVFLAVLTPIWTGLPGAVNNLWNTQRREDAVNLLRQTFKYAVVFTTPFACVVLFWNDFILEKYAGPGFGQGRVVIPWIIAAYSLEYFSSFYRFIFAWFEKTKIFLITFPIAVVINISANILLVPIYGLTGAASATTIAYAVLLLLEIYFSSRYLKPGFPLMRSFGVILLGIVLARFISSMPHDSWQSFFTQIIIFWGAYFVSLWITRLLDVTELQQLFRLLLRRKQVPVD